jgi:hypothetical protein
MILRKTDYFNVNYQFGNFGQSPSHGGKGKQKRRVIE